MDEKTALVIGGTSGLGLELALKLRETHDNVIVTGRTETTHSDIDFRGLDLSADISLMGRLNDFVRDLPVVDMVIYAAGFYQEKTVDELGDQDIDDMLSVGLGACMKVIARILRKQETLPCLIAITSTSQWTPRLYEPAYTAAKAGLGMLGDSIALDPAVEKVLVAAPSGMKTRFWADTDKDTSTMLEAAWVAEVILADLFQFGVSYEYRYARILRNPSRVEIVVTRY